MKRKEYKWYLQTEHLYTHEILKSNKADWHQERLFRKQVLGEIINYEQLQVLPFARGALMAKLTGEDYFHIHSLTETTLSFFAGYDTRVFPTVREGGKEVIITTELHCNTNTF